MNGSWSKGCGAALCVAVLVASWGCGSRSPAVVEADLRQAELLRKHFSGGSSAQGGGGPTLPDPTGFATLKGTFRVAGSVSPLPPLTVSGDHATYCSPGGNPPPDERLVVDSNGGIRDVLIYVDTKIPETWPEDEIHLARKEMQLAGEEGFDQKFCIFLSHVFPIRSTQSVEVRNSDTVGHNTNIAGKGRGAVNFNLPAGSTEIYQPGPESSKPFAVSCSVHPWMRSWMMVRDNPYFAVSDSTGAFEIPQIPAGEGIELTFRAWQEAASFLGEVTVTYTVDGETVKDNVTEKWKKGRFKLSLKPGQTATLDVTLTPAALSVN